MDFTPLRGVKLCTDIDPEYQTRVLLQKIKTAVETQLKVKCVECIGDRQVQATLNEGYDGIYFGTSMSDELRQIGWFVAGVHKHYRDPTITLEKIGLN